jgi:insecticidal toxin complex protein TccC
MPASTMGMHYNTPKVSVFDPRGLAVCSVDYWREVEGICAQARFNRMLHDAAGFPIKQWDPRLWALHKDDPAVPANLTTVHSLLGHPVCTKSVDAGSTVSLFGLADQVLFSWDSRGIRREVEYDDLLRPLAVFEHLATEPRRCAERMEYGRAEPSAQDHNQCGQLIRQDGPGGTVLFESFAITGPCTRQVQHFTLEAVAPDWPEPIAERQALLEPGDGAISTWRYSQQGDVLERIDARQNTQKFDFTLDGRLRQSALKLAGKLTWQTLVREIEYNAQGKITHQVSGKNISTALKYSPEDGRLMELRTHGEHTDALQHLVYAYDRMGNVLSIEDKAQAVRFFNNQRINPVSRFIYDSLGRLIGSTGREAGAPNKGPASVGRNDPAALSTYSQTYSYDDGDNLVKLEHVGAQSPGRQLEAARYSNRCLPWRNGRPPSEDDIAAAFDARGNLLELDQGRFLTWDLRNQLHSVSPVERDSERNDCECYFYDTGGQRVRKIRSLQTNARTVKAEVRYLQGLELRTDSGTGEVLHVITAQAGLNTVRVLHWESDPPSGVNDQYRYNLVDHLTSCTVELTDDAHIISQEVFYPFGETAWFTGSDVDYKTIRYSGKERDATSLYYYGFRYYISWLQRWLSPDPALAIDGLNLYCMVRNNPTGLVDPDGLAPNNDKPRVPAWPPQSSVNAPVAVKPVVPLRPFRPHSALTVQPSSAAVAPQRPPPISLPTAVKSNRALPAYAGGSMNAGSHQLLLGPSGAVIAMRGDDRSPETIRKAGGFFPRDNRGPEIKDEFRQAAVGKSMNTLSQEHVRSPVPGYVSTGMDENSGGYGDTRAYLYRMEIPGLAERAINDQTLGLNTSFEFIPKGRLHARLLMSGSTLDQSKFVAMIPPMTVEMTFITPIPSAYIVAYREAKSTEWKPF